jgi:hypothetical protein
MLSHDHALCKSLKNSYTAGISALAKTRATSGEAAKPTTGILEGIPFALGLSSREFSGSLRFPNDPE